MHIICELCQNRGCSCWEDSRAKTFSKLTITTIEYGRFRITNRVTKNLLEYRAPFVCAGPDNLWNQQNNVSLRGPRNKGIKLVHPSDSWPICNYSHLYRENAE